MCAPPSASHRAGMSRPIARAGFPPLCGLGRLYSRESASTLGADAAGLLRGPVLVTDQPVAGHGPRKSGVVSRGSAFNTHAPGQHELRLRAPSAESGATSGKSPSIGGRVPVGPSIEIRPCAGSRPERAASRNAPGAGEGGVAAAQGYSAAAEAPKDSGSGIGRPNGGVGRDESGASLEPTRKPGQAISREGAIKTGPYTSSGTGGCGEGYETSPSQPRPAAQAVIARGVTVGGDESGTAVSNSREGASQVRRWRRRARPGSGQPFLGVPPSTGRGPRAPAPSGMTIRATRSSDDASTSVISRKVCHV